jgi:gamma-glutamylcyclotransferase (GGCT)/AIG2-like uncharacterized protein YtfP
MPHDRSSQLYFAYGSNLNPVDFDDVCEDLGFPTGLMHFRGNAWLPDHELAFSRYAPSREGGVLDVRPCPGQLVPGALFEIHEEGLKALDRKEGVPRAYERYPVTVLGPRGEHLAVLTYRVVPARAEPYHQPSESYLNIVRDGYMAWNVPDDGQLLAAAAGQRPPCPDTFFVYGTLMGGESRHRYMKRFGVLETKEATTPGRLLHLGSYPGLVQPGHPDCRVRGEFVRLREPLAALEVLDKVEGFEGFGRPGSLYERIWVQVAFAQPHQGFGWAWSYRYAGDCDRFPDIPSGNWRQA